MSAASESRLLSSITLKHHAMSTHTAGMILLLFLPFLLSLLGKAAMPKMLCLVASLVAALLAVKFYLAILPWAAGLAIAVISVHAGCRRRAMSP
jgi:hypothetical protein